MLLAQSEEEFVDQLREIFATESTKKIIGTLLAMSQEEAKDEFTDLV